MPSHKRGHLTGLGASDALARATQRPTTQGYRVAAQNGPITVTGVRPRQPAKVLADFERRSGHGLIPSHAEERAAAKDAAANRKIEEDMN
jgi:hypothetical protein